MKPSKAAETFLRRAVRRGARVLDKAFPDWYTQRRLKLTKLRMPSSVSCVRGQLGRQYGELEVEVALGEAGYDGNFPCELGMDLNYQSPRTGGHWEILDDEWRKQVHARRAKATA